MSLRPTILVSRMIRLSTGQTIIIDDAKNTLARYNTECGRGIMHTPEWDKAMAELQREFDAGTLA